MSRVTLPILDAVTLTAACTQIIAEARAAFARLASLPVADVSPATVLDEWDRIGMLVENIEGPISILNNVHPDKSVRDAADDAISFFFNGIGQLAHALARGVGALILVVNNCNGECL